MKRLWPRKLRAQFALLLASALILANVMAFVLLVADRVRFSREAFDDVVASELAALVNVIETVPEHRVRSVLRRVGNRGARVEILPEPVIDATGASERERAIASEISASLDGREVRVSLTRSAPPGFGRPGREGGHGHSPPPHGPPRVVIALPVTVSGESAWLNVVALQGRVGPIGFHALFMGLVLSLAAVLGGGLWFLRRMTRPLGMLQSAAEAAGRGDRAARVPEDGAAEIAGVARAFNDMQARIARFDAERMRTLAAVAHDLRTPLTSLRIRAELLDGDEAASIIATVEEMTVMAEGLLAYARGEAEFEAAERVELSPLLSRLAEDSGAAFAPIDGVAVIGRPVALARLFTNLVDNALRYGGGAEIGVDVSEGMARVSILDRGPGIPEERLQSMLDPFVRGDDSRNAETGGAGLGLSIAKSIAVGHGGSVSLSNREGGGLRAEVRLPLA